MFQEETNVSRIVQTEILSNPSASEVSDKHLEEPIINKEIPKKSPHKRKRKTHPSTWNKNQRKILRNQGLAYKSSCKKQIEGAEIGPPCGCPKRCFTAIPKDKISDIFKEFWNIKNFDLQNSYLCGLIKAIPIKRKYTKTENSRRNHTFEFYIKIGTDQLKVCKKAFLALHGLHKHRGRVENLQKHLLSNTTTPPRDKRGRHDNRPNKITEDNLNIIRKHIESIPTYESHYSRRQGEKKRKYLGCHLNISKLYELYAEMCEETNVEPVSSAAYRRVFCNEYNIGFKEPSIDTCNYCDERRILIENSTDINKRAQAEIELKVHLAKADKITETLAELKSEAKEKPEDIQVIAFDLQQALPTPKLSTNIAFYKRKLWTYNLSIHNCSDGNGHMFVWPEFIAKRGADEVASCVLSYIQTCQKRGKNLYMFTDNCSGQNKNLTMISLMIALIENNMYESVTHIMPPPGHTRLPCDSDQALIEREQAKHQFIYTTDDWITIITKSSKKHFIVKCMDRKDFLQISSLNSLITKRQVALDGTTLNMRDVSCFRVSKNPDPFTLQFKRSYSELEEWHLVSFRKRGSKPKMSLSDLPYKNVNLVPITTKKFQDLMTLLAFIPPVHHTFFKNIPHEDGVDAE